MDTSAEDAIEPGLKVKLQLSAPIPSDAGAEDRTEPHDQVQYEAVQASLAAVRAAREAAQLRAQRERRRARALVATLAGFIGAGVYGTAVLSGPTAEAQPAPGGESVAVTAPPIVLEEALPSAESPEAPAEPVEAEAPAPARAEAPVRRAPRVEPEPPAHARAAVAACEETFARRQWRRAAEACAKAFELHETATMAMRAAHAQHARGHFGEAGDWAHRALAHDDEQAEAYVIVAHAEEQGGRAEAAAEAYRSYLRLAPNGWHAGQARAALRAR